MEASCDVQSLAEIGKLYAHFPSEVRSQPTWIWVYLFQQFSSQHHTMRLQCIFFMGEERFAYFICTSQSHIVANNVFWTVPKKIKFSFHFTVTDSWNFRPRLVTSVRWISQTAKTALKCMTEIAGYSEKVSGFIETGFERPAFSKPHIYFSFTRSTTAVLW